MQEPIDIQICLAFLDRNSGAIRTLLSEHPQHLQTPHGLGTWFHEAARVGDVSLMEFLYERGLNVNVVTNESYGPPLMALVHLIKQFKMVHQTFTRHNRGDHNMIELGTIFQGTITDVRTFGVFLKHQEDDVFVDIVDVSWRPGFDPTKELHVGDTMDVLALRYIHDKGYYAGSIKRVRQDENPYRSLVQFMPGHVFRGKVYTVYRDLTSVIMPGGAIGLVDNHRILKQLKPGDSIAVTISALDVDEGRLVLHPSSE